MSELIELTTLILLLIPGALFCLAVNVVYEKEMIFGRVPDIYDAITERIEGRSVFLVHLAPIKGYKGGLRVFWIGLRAWTLEQIGKLLRWLRKPLFECVLCHASIYGFLAFVALMPVHGLPLGFVLYYLPLLLGALVLNFQYTPNV